MTVRPSHRPSLSGELAVVTGAAVDCANSKDAIDAIKIWRSKELGWEGIRVDAARPSLVCTEFHQAAGDPDRVARAVKANPLYCGGCPDEVADAAVWLPCNEAFHVTVGSLDDGHGRLRFNMKHSK